MLREDTMKKTDYIAQQYLVAEYISSFLTDYGLKQWFVAKECRISQTDFSKFLNHRLALNEKQMLRLHNYCANYTARHGQEVQDILPKNITYANMEGQ